METMTIINIGNAYRIISKTTGKNLGTYSYIVGNERSRKIARTKATSHLKDIEFFKHKR